MKKIVEIFWKIIKIIDDYKALLAFVFFAVFLTVGGKNSVVRLVRLKSETKALEQRRDELIKKIQEDSLYFHKLDRDDRIFERYLREKYYFHKPDEDVYIIRDL